MLIDMILAIALLLGTGAAFNALAHAFSREN